MHKIEKELLKATKAAGQEDDEDRQEYLERLVFAVNELDREAWEGLSGAAQDWQNAAVDADDNKKPIPDFETEAKPAKPKLAQRRAKTSAEEPEEEEEQEKPAKAAKGARAPSNAKATPKAPAKPRPPGGMSAQSFVRHYCATHPEADADTIAEALTKAGHKLTKSSIGTIRSDFRAAARALKELGYLKRDVNLGV